MNIKVTFPPDTALSDRERAEAAECAHNGVVLWAATRELAAMVQDHPAGLRYRFNPVRVALAEAKVTDSESIRRLEARLADARRIAHGVK